MTDPKQLHPAPEQLADYGLGRLSEPDSAAVYEHLEGCEDCRKTVEVLPDDTLASLVRTAAQVPGLPPGPEDEHRASLSGNTPLPDRSSQVEGTVAYSPDQATQAPNSAAPTPGDRASRVAGPERDTLHVPAPLLEHPRYRVLELLGAGGMGSVYKAEHLLMGRTVALKVIGRQLLDRPGMLERFRREVRAAAHLSHANIATAFDAEQAGDAHFLVMEFIEGKSLAQVVADQGPLPVDQACEVARQAALGLQHAFTRGMVHRDIKPHNLMRTPDGQVKILDFGLAHFVSENVPTEALTESGVVMGTPDYIAPEQARDAHSADIRADIYSLGCTLYFLLTGHPPFPEGTYMSKLTAHLERSPRSLTQFRPDVPPGLARVVERMMAKDPARRYQTPAEVAEALTPFANPAAVPARRRRPMIVAAMLLAALGVGGYLFGPAVYRIATNQGQLVIETDDPDVEVVVKQGGKEVKIIDPKSGKEVTLKAGTYQLELAQGKEGLMLSTDHFTLERGGREIVKVQLEPAAGVPGEKPAPGAVADKPGAFTEIRQFVGHQGPVNSVALSPDGRYALSGSGWPDGDKTLRLWEVATGKEIRRFLGHTDQVRSVAFSPDGKLAASGSFDNTVRLWEVPSGREVKCFVGHTSVVNDVVFSPDGHYLASAGAYDQTVRLWNLQTKQQEKVLRGHTERVQAVAFSPDGSCLVSGGWDRTLRLWDVTTGKLIRSFPAFGHDVEAVAFSPDGRHILSGGGNDSAARLWKVETGEQVRAFRTDERVMTVAFMPDGQHILTGGHDATLRLWDAATGVQLASSKMTAGSIFSMALSPDGRSVLLGGGTRMEGEKVVPSGDYALRLWRLPDLSLLEPVGEVRRFEGHTGVVWSVAFSADGRRVLSGGEDRVLRLWDVATGKEVRPFRGHTASVASVAFSADGRRVLSGSADGTMRLWDAETGKELRRFLGYSGFVHSVAFSPDGRRALSGTFDRTIRLWEVRSGRELRRFEGHTDGIASVAFSADGRRVLSGSADGTMRLWDAETGKELRRFGGHPNWVLSVALSPDGLRALAAVAFDPTPWLWDAETGKELRRLEGHTGGVSGVAFSPGGRRALSASDDKTLRLWDVETGNELRRFEGHTGAVKCVAFSPDGRWAVSGGVDRTLRLWRLPDAPAGERR